MLVGPDREYATGAKDPDRLGKELINIEPVERLGDSNQIDRGRVQRGSLGSRDAIRNALYWRSRVNLRCTGVSGDHDVKVFGERASCLAVAGRAIPGACTTFRAACEECEQRLRVRGSVRTVVTGVAGEMIFEIAAFGTELNQG